MPVAGSACPPVSEVSEVLTTPGPGTHIFVKGQQAGCMVSDPVPCSGWQESRCL